MITPRSPEVPPKYSATIAPIIARTVATFSAVNRYGRAVGTRTRRKICTWPPAEGGISPSDSRRERGDDRRAAPDREAPERLLEREPAGAEELAPVVPERARDQRGLRKQEVL